jgi:small nuclear ribonucleoprotein (snRNP)-like protein
MLIQLMLLQVTLNDQRVLEGDFQCLDKQGNLILGNSVEACVNPTSGKREERPMGMVLISKDRQAKVEVQVCVLMCCIKHELGIC